MLIPRCVHWVHEEELVEAFVLGDVTITGRPTEVRTDASAPIFATIFFFAVGDTVLAFVGDWIACALAFDGARAATSVGATTGFVFALGDAIGVVAGVVVLPHTVNLPLLAP